MNDDKNIEVPVASFLYILHIAAYRHIKISSLRLKRTLGIYFILTMTIPNRVPEAAAQLFVYRNTWYLVPTQICQIHIKCLPVVHGIDLSRADIHVRPVPPSTLCLER